MAQSVTSTAPGLRRTLTLWDAVFYGIVLVQPVAPMGIFGVVSQEARGHVITTILIGMFAMMLTAVSYGRMARIYPNAGSAFAYVGQELHPGLGYVTGWSMVMDYVLNPMICTIYCSKVAMTFIPGVPYAVWVAVFAAVFTMLNLRGVKASARTNEVLAIGMFVVVVLFVGAALRYLFSAPLDRADLLRPFYDPETFALPAVLTGASIACLTYIGFDGISTLSEEVENPRRNILLATVLTCLITGVLASILVYLAQLVWGNWTGFPRRGHGVHTRGRKGRWRVALHARERDAARRESRIGHGRTSRRGTPPLRHGKEQCAAPTLLRDRRREESHSA